MFFKKKKIQVALVEGRKAIIASIYNIISVILKDMLKHDYSEKELSVSAAIVTNILICRNETRADPRNLNNSLANELRDISSKQLLKEAVAMVLILDYYIGDFKDISNIDRIAEAEKLVDSLTELLISKLNPSISKAEDIYTISIRMSEALNNIAIGGF
ncbi:MAG: hypothetical protein GXO79_10995 [Chlorobi bacterium]|nr:hypothetical protein [Chlorobiota bacterium]